MNQPITPPTALLNSSLSFGIAKSFALSLAVGTEYVGRAAGMRAVARPLGSSGKSSGYVNLPDPPAGDDLALVSAMARGDERAAATLYDRHSAVMFALACRIVGERADADEVVLEAFTQAWREAARYQTSRGSVAGWLTTITRTRALDLVRARGRRSKAVDNASRAIVDEPIAVANNVQSASDQLVTDERASAVTSALDVLPKAQRYAIELAFFEGLSHSEIADRLSEPLGTVKTRIRLGMLKLRDVLLPMAQESVS